VVSVHLNKQVTFQRPRHGPLELLEVEGGPCEALGLEQRVEAHEAREDAVLAAPRLVALGEALQRRIGAECQRAAVSDCGHVANVAFGQLPDDARERDAARRLGVKEVCGAALLRGRRALDVTAPVIDVGATGARQLLVPRGRVDLKAHGYDLTMRWRSKSRRAGPPVAQRFDYESTVRLLVDRGLDEEVVRFNSILEPHLEFIRETMIERLKPYRGENGTHWNGELKDQPYASDLDCAS